MSPEDFQWEPVPGKVIGRCKIPEAGRNRPGIFTKQQGTKEAKMAETERGRRE